jgi:hypothetical protein
MFEIEGGKLVMYMVRPYGNKHVLELQIVFKANCVCVFVWYINLDVATETPTPPGRQKYTVIRNDCRGFNELSYTVHLR